MHFFFCYYFAFCNDFIKFLKDLSLLQLYVNIFFKDDFHTIDFQ